MVQLLISKQFFLVKLGNYISVERGKEWNIFIELRQLEEIRITGRGFVCLFCAHFRADTIFRQALLFSHQMALFSQYLIFLTYIFTESILHMERGWECFLLICQIFNYALTHPGISAKSGAPDDSMCIFPVSHGTAARAGLSLFSNYQSYKKSSLQSNASKVQSIH